MYVCFFYNTIFTQHKYDDYRLLKIAKEWVDFDFAKALENIGFGELATVFHMEKKRCLSQRDLKKVLKWMDDSGFDELYLPVASASGGWVL